MVPPLTARLSSSLGRTVDVQRMSKTARLVRKKYTGVWRPGCRLMAVTMRVFPARAPRKRRGNKTGKRPRSPGSSEKLCRANSSADEWLCVSTRCSSPRSLWDTAGLAQGDMGWRGTAAGKLAVGSFAAEST